jgi:hypothetical protein
VITLITGEKLVVLESSDEVASAVIKVRRQCEDPRLAARTLRAGDLFCDAGER